MSRNVRSCQRGCPERLSERGAARREPRSRSSISSFQSAAAYSNSWPITQRRICGFLASLHSTIVISPSASTTTTSALPAFEVLTSVETAVGRLSTPGSRDGESAIRSLSLRSLGGLFLSIGSLRPSTMRTIVVAPSKPPGCAGGSRAPTASPTSFRFRRKGPYGRPPCLIQIGANDLLEDLRVALRSTASDSLSWCDFQ